jgi:hypothetical protein
MTDRRSFLQSSLVLATAATGGLTGPAAAQAAREGKDPVGESSAVRLFIFERRYGEAVRAAAHARRAGAGVWAVNGDLTALWYDHLALAWKAGPQFLAGTTTAPVLFLLETLAVDHRMTVSWRDTHGPALEGRPDHLLFGPAAGRRNPDLVSWIITPRPAASQA